MTTDTNKLPSPEKELRADLWGTMSVSQLHRQQDILLDRLMKLQSMSPYGVAPTTGVAGLTKVLQQAMADLTRLIDEKSSVAKPRKEPHGK
jgi:hypothetical protein